MKRLKRYADLRFGNNLQDETVYIYSLSDTDGPPRYEWRVYIWFVVGVNKKELLNKLANHDCMEVFGDYFDSHHNFQVASSNNFTETIEFITQGNYIWVDASQITDGITWIFLNEGHEKFVLSEEAKAE